MSGLVGPASFFLMAFSKGKWRSALAPIAVLSVYAILQISLGGRAAVTAQVLCGAWLFHHSVRRIPRVVFAVLGAVLIIALPVIGVVRNTIGESRTSAETLGAEVRSLDNPVVALLSETGGSMATIAYTTQLVPAERQFDLGTSYAYGALAIMPNLFWDIHPSGVHGTLSRWLVSTVALRTANIHGGLGFSCLAEAYLNFSWPGIVFVPALLGFGLVRLTNWAESSGDPLSLALLATCLVPLLIYARGEAIDTFRDVAWYALLPYCAIKAPGGSGRFGRPRTNEGASRNWLRESRRDRDLAA